MTQANGTIFEVFSSKTSAMMSSDKMQFNLFKSKAQRGKVMKATKEDGPASFKVAENSDEADMLVDYQDMQMAMAQPGGLGDAIRMVV